MCECWHVLALDLVDKLPRWHVILNTCTAQKTRKKCEDKLPLLFKYSAWAALHEQVGDPLHPEGLQISNPTNDSQRPKSRRPCASCDSEYKVLPEFHIGNDAAHTATRGQIRNRSVPFEAFPEATSHETQHMKGWLGTISIWGWKVEKTFLSVNKMLRVLATDAAERSQSADGPMTRIRRSRSHTGLLWAWRHSGESLRTLHDLGPRPLSIFPLPQICFLTFQLKPESNPNLSKLMSNKHSS